MAVQPAYRDAERTNNSDRPSKQYRDLNLNFSRHPVTKGLTVLTDASAVKRSVRNLVQYGHYEKPFHPEIGSGVRDLLFENMTPFVANTLARKIEDTINNFEPRARLIGVATTPDFDRNEYKRYLKWFGKPGKPKCTLCSKKKKNSKLITE